jgi:hypothetical protein
MNTGTIRGLALVVSSLVMGCAGSKPTVESAGAASATGAAPATPPGAGAASSAPAGASSAAGASQAGPATAQSPQATQPAASTPPAERPFAKTPLEAQSLIQDQIDKHTKVLWACVTDYRSKKGDPHKPVVVDIGIDQEGTLLGVVTPNKKQGDLDPALKDCLMAALHGLAFPRSHAGVITVRQSFTDVAVTP